MKHNEDELKYICTPVLKFTFESLRETLYHELFKKIMAPFILFYLWKSVSIKAWSKNSVDLSMFILRGVIKSSIEQRKKRSILLPSDLICLARFARIRIKINN